MGRGRAQIEPRDRGCPPWPCVHCDATGRIPRPPLTPDQVAALPDGARVVVRAPGDWLLPVTARIRQSGKYAGMPVYRRVSKESWRKLQPGRVWLAEDADD